MKRLFFLLSFIAFSFFACEEIPPVVTGSMPGDNNPVPPKEQKRQVLIEEFTGVSCIQCPAGSAIIKDLLGTHGQQLIAISIHSAPTFSEPYPQSQYDFRTSEGNSFYSYLGSPIGFPSATVNRRLFDGRTKLQMGKGEWAGFIEEEKAVAPKVKIGIESDFDAVSRNAAIEVTLFVEEIITETDVNLSVIFTENDIVDHQLTPGSSPDTDPTYVHEHVLRGMATPFDGSPITEPLTVGAVITKTFDYTIPAEWKEDNVNVIAVVNLNGEKKEVLQAHEVHLVN